MLSSHPYSNLRAVIRPLVFAVFAALIPAACDNVKDPIGPDPIGPTPVGDRIEVFEFGEFALYVPASVDITKGLILALGGPDTRGFATGKPMGAPIASVEESLQVLGLEFRSLAASYGLAVLGSSLAAMTNSPESDQLLFDAIGTAAKMSGRPGLVSVPVLLYGMSGGAPEASGFTVRNPERVAGLFLKVPSAVSSVTSDKAMGVPTYMILAALDTLVDNAALMAAFAANRRAGALWAVAEEPGVLHHSLTAPQRYLTITWIRAILELRLPPTPGWDKLLWVNETSGWLANRATLEAAPWATYTGDRRSASWLPSLGTAVEWQQFVTDNWW